MLKGYQFSLDLDVLFNELVGGSLNRVQQHLYQNKPGWASFKVWWIFLRVMNAYAAEAKSVFSFYAGLGNLWLSAAKPPHKFG